MFAGKEGRNHIKNHDFIWLGRSISGASPENIYNATECRIVSYPVISDTMVYDTMWYDATFYYVALYMFSGLVVFCIASASISGKGATKPVNLHCRGTLGIQDDQQNASSMLYYAMLYCAMLHHAMPYCTILRYTILYCVMLRDANA